MTERSFSTGDGAAGFKSNYFGALSSLIDHENGLVLVVNLG